MAKLHLLNKKSLFKEKRKKNDEKREKKRAKKSIFNKGKRFDMLKTNNKMVIKEAQKMEKCQENNMEEQIQEMDQENNQNHVDNAGIEGLSADDLQQIKELIKMYQRRSRNKRAQREKRKEVQENLAEVSRMIRETQRTIKDVYQFEPCRQLCDLVVNIRQNVYRNVEEVREELEYIIESFGIAQFEAMAGDEFDAKYHEQVYSNVTDARGKEIVYVYSPGYTIDDEVIFKAQVSVKDINVEGENE